MCFRPVGQCFSSGECAAHSCFSAHCCGRSERWEDRLLTTSHSPPTTSLPFTTGVLHGWEERSEAGESTSTPPPYTLPALNFTHCPCLLSSGKHFSFKFNVPPSVSQSSYSSPLRVAAFFEVCRVCLFPWLSFWLMDMLWWSDKAVMKRGG